MTYAFICPQCQRPIRKAQRFCEYCGADLAIDTPLGELLPQLSNLEKSNANLEPEVLTPKLGETLVQAGKITPQQLAQALSYQRQQASIGRQVRLGRALRELGILDEETVDEAVTVQILQLQKALKQANQELERRVQERTQELHQALERIRELYQIKTNFIANVSHELRTPLTMLKGYLEMMAEGAFGEVNPDQAEALQALIKAENRLEKLIDDLILFSYAERGELSLTLIPSRIGDLLEKKIAELQPQARSKGVTLQSKVPAQLPLVRCDAEKIGWVIGELLTNALKFTPSGGNVLVKAAADNGLVNITVQDTGIGIAAERIEEIFQPFHQLDGSTTRRYGGTGLGLALLQRILEAHGSQVRVKSEVGHGSSFEFSLPAIKAAHSEQT
ncbi:MAG: ATP-binding protein [Anaerolineales bacterium]